MNIDNVVADFDVVSKYLKENALVKLAKKTFKERLDRSEVSQEEKDRLVVEFDKQLSLLLLPEVIKLSFSFPLLVKQAAEAQSKIDGTKAQKEVLEKEVAILDIELANAPAKIAKELDILDKQIEGITNHYKNNTMKSLTEMIALFAQTESIPAGDDLNPDTWIKDKIKAIASELSGHTL